MNGSNLYPDRKKEKDAAEEVKRQDEWQKSENPSGQKGGQSSYPQDKTTDDTTDQGEDVIDYSNDVVERGEDFSTDEENLSDEE